MKNVLIKLWLPMVAMLLGFTACEDPIIDDMINDELPTVLTNEVTDITASGALCGGYVSAQGGSEVVARGVCYSTTPNPEVNNSRTNDGQGMGRYTSTLEGLTAATTYYIRAYATNTNGTAYGEERSFTTATDTGDTEDTTQNNGDIPTVTTNDVTEIAANSAVCGGNVVSDGGNAVTAYGVCWSTTRNPTIDNSYTQEGQGTGSFVSNITELSENTTYYVRAYATNINGTAYGEERSFTTMAGNTINGHEYVDLGLPSGLKWATCNVGATTPEEYGDYFAWGETYAKTDYSHNNCVTMDIEFTNGFADISGNSNYDAATANWGASWRMHTLDEMRELMNNCTFTWTTQNGTTGTLVTGTNGNSIFFPANGRYYSTSCREDGVQGLYWSSTAFAELPRTASCHLDLSRERHYVNWDIRYYGFGVRPVSN